MDVDVRPIDMANEAELLQAFDLESAATSELRGPSWSPLPGDVRLRRWTSTPEFTYYLVGAWRGADLVGFGQRTFWSGEPDDYFYLVGEHSSTSSLKSSERDGGDERQVHH